MSQTSPSPDSQAAPWVVLKFGGTSVAGLAQWQRIAALARQRRAEGYRVLLVCSAVAGVTNALQALAQAGPTNDAALDALLNRHRQLATELDVDADAVLEPGLALLRMSLAESPGPARTAALLAMGEWFSTQLGAAYLSQALDVAWVDAREALVALPEDEAHPRRWLSARCAAGFDADLANRWIQLAPVLVCPGFVASDAEGRTVLLGRGGSDTSAALLAGRLGAQRVEIWTDVRGLYSADPRCEPEARLIEHLSYAEALEMAAGGARVIHGQAIRAAAEVAIPLSIHELSGPDRVGTLVSAQDPDQAPGIRAVTSQADMAVLLLENLDTRQQVGFLARVFAAVAGQGVSVDLVATSETTTTLAINRAANHLDNGRLQQLVQALQVLCSVQLHANCACVNLVGRGARLALGRMAPLAKFLATRPLLMTSQSANDLGISLLVRAQDADAMVRLLHRSLVVSA